jgi:hypothetical protein
MWENKKEVKNKKMAKRLEEREKMRIRFEKHWSKLLNWESEELGVHIDQVSSPRPRMR